MFNIISTAFLATLAVGTRDMFQKKKKILGKKEKRREKERRQEEKRKVMGVQGKLIMTFTILAESVFFGHIKL